MMQAWVLAAAMAAQTNGIMRDGFEPPGWCPPGRITSSVVAWRYDGIGRRMIDVRYASEIYGRFYATDPAPLPYPWAQTYQIFWSFPRAGYVAAEFSVPDDVPLHQHQQFWHGETLPGPPIDMAVSDRCGDFSPPEPWCAAYNRGTGASLVGTNLPLSPWMTGCELSPGRTYYANIRISDPGISHSDCGAVTCRITTQSNHTP